MATEMEMADRRAPASGDAQSAAELEPETLYAGDTIEFYSMAFVFGDPRGHREAKIHRICTAKSEYPLEIDSDELVALTMMIKRKYDRQGVELPSEDAKWRKLRTFDLIDGQVAGVRRNTLLNRALQSAVSDAMDTTMRLVTGKSSKSSKERMANISSFFTKKPERSATASAKRAVSTSTITISSFFTRADSTPSHKRSRLLSADSNSGKRRHRDRRDFMKDELQARRTNSKKDDQSDKIKIVKPKCRLQAFVEHLEEKKKTTGLGLDAYIAIDNNRKEVLKAMETDGSLDPSTEAAMAMNQWEEKKDRQKRKMESMDSWMSSARSSSTAKRDRLKLPSKSSYRESPTPEKKSSKLSFIMEDPPSPPPPSPAIGHSTMRHKNRSKQSAALPRDYGKKKHDEGIPKKTFVNTWVRRR